MQKLGVTIELMNKNIFRELIFAESFMSSNLPLIIAQLRLASLASDLYHRSTAEALSQRSGGQRSKGHVSLMSSGMWHWNTRWRKSVPFGSLRRSSLPTPSFPHGRLLLRPPAAAAELWCCRNKIAPLLLQPEDTSWRCDKTLMPSDSR